MACQKLQIILLYRIGLHCPSRLVTMRATVHVASWDSERVVGNSYTASLDPELPQSLPSHTSLMVHAPIRINFHVDGWAAGPCETLTLGLLQGDPTGIQDPATPGGERYFLLTISNEIVRFIVLIAVGWGFAKASPSCSPSATANRTQSEESPRPCRPTASRPCLYWHRFG